VFDILGNLVTSFQSFSTKVGLSVDLRNLSNGIYSVQLVDLAGNSSVAKVVKNN
jgi:hypothetical protein